MAGVSRERGVCPEYQRLLNKCQDALFSWQQHAALISRNTRMGQKVTADLRRLESTYKRAYAELERHEHACPDCQYVSNVGGLDFESMSSALTYYRRSA